MNATDGARKNELIKEIQDERDKATSSVSTQTRTLALGVLALVWLLLNGTNETLSNSFGSYTTQLLWIALLCIAAVALDYLQYIATAIDTSEALSDSKKATQIDQVGFNDEGWPKLVTNISFCTKIIVTSIAAIWLLVVIAYQLLSSINV